MLGHSILCSVRLGRVEKITDMPRQYRLASLSQRTLQPKIVKGLGKIYLQVLIHASHIGLINRCWQHQDGECTRHLLCEGLLHFHDVQAPTPY